VAALRRDRAAVQAQNGEPGLPARALALDLLAAVLDRGRPLDEAWAAHPGLGKLEPRDRAFARHLTATTLRRLGQIDDLLGRCLRKPLPKALAPVRHALRIGAAQRLFLDTPAHAAVDSSVALVRTLGHESHTGLVNAVLRRIAKEGPAWLAAQDVERLNTPGWLWRSWQAAYGDATTRAIAAAHRAEPPLDLTLRHDADADAWAERLDAAVLPTGSLRLAATRAVESLPGFADGVWWVQDAAAALPAKLLLGARGDRRTVADLCAAPGGKTAQLADAGLDVIAVDRAAPRLQRLRDNLTRLHLCATVAQADATEWRPAHPVDAVLLDVPCSATGTIRRHPDVAQLKRPGDIAALAAMQDRLLRAAAAMLAPGGVLLFCSCSLQPEEGPERIAALLRDEPRFARQPIAPDELPDLAAAITTDGDLRTLPCHWAERGGIDGFYAARLLRR
jgi:16S rRNA (cytosine967-C5)-methyltransferase